MLKNFLEQQVTMTTPSTCAATPSPSPPPAMRAAMAAAPLGDDVFGDDPSVNALQEKIAGDARLRGGAVRAHRHAEQPLRRSCRTASAATSTSSARCSTATAGKAAAPRCSAACSRSRWTTSRTARWRWPTSRPPSSRTIRTSRARRLLALENTLGGKVLPFDLPAAGDGAGAVARACRRHLDGARLFNAAVAQAAATGSDRARRSAPHRRAASTASRSASARAWARRSARRCAARAS